MANDVALAKIILLIILGYEFQGFGERALWITSCLTGQSPGNVDIVMRVSTKSTETQWSANLKDTIDVYALQGKRPHMEDRYAIKVVGDSMAFAVFDGHGGKDMAEYAAEYLLLKIINAINKVTTEHEIREEISETFLQFNDEARRPIYEFRKSRSGSTVVLGVVHGKKLYIANVGDSRAVAIRTYGRVSAITRDHKASDPYEIERVGSYNIEKDMYGHNRLGGQSMVTRSLGDYDLEGNGMIAKPDLFTIDLKGNTKYIVLASDGLWDEISNRYAGRFILFKTYVSQTTLFGAEQLAKKAMEKGSKDNITVMIVKIATIRAWLENAPRGKKC